MGVWLYCVFLAFGVVRGIMMRDSDATFVNGSAVPWQCLEPKDKSENLVEVGESMFACAKRSLYVSLVNHVDSNSVDLGDGVTFIRDTNGPPPTTRENFLQGEPSSFRGLLDAYSEFLSRRSARWDLGFLYPGLVMRIGPTMTGSGFLEFRLEKRLDYHDRATLGPGQIIVRRTILPHLLGFRMNLSSILPILVGIILIVTKNAFVFSKVTLFLSVLLTLKSLFLLHAFKGPDSGDYPQSTLNHRPPIAHDPVDFEDGGLTITTVNRPRPQGYSVSESLSDSFLSQIVKRLPPYNNVNDSTMPKRSRTGKRNFSWEKKR